MARHVLLAEDAANGTGTEQDWDGGTLVLTGHGTWDGASAALQYAPHPPSGQTLTPIATGKTVDGTTPINTFADLPSGKIRVVISGGGGSESVTVIASRAK